MSMRELIDTIELMETDLDNPFDYKETSPGSYFFSYRTPDGKFYHGEVALDEGTTKPRRGVTNHSPFNNRILTLIDSTDDVEYGYLQYSIDQEFRGFNTQGFARQILSTVIACTLDWLEQHPRIGYLVYTAAANDNTNNRPGAYRALSHLMAKKYGFKAFSETTGIHNEYMFVMQVRQ
jgi:hypothetical protein